MGAVARTTEGDGLFIAKTQIRAEALALPAEERVELADELWASIQQDQGELPVWRWQKEVLEERLKRLEENPEAGSTWEEVKAELWPEP